MCVYTSTFDLYAKNEWNTEETKVSKISGI